MIQPTLTKQFIQFLQDELAIPADSLAIALRHQGQSSPNVLPMILWQYGLVTLDQMDEMFDWLETA
ncbi:MAG: DUF2949 domain-containing protein [Cyanobacteria bacterium P01_G01_bin.54]